MFLLIGSLGIWEILFIFLLAMLLFGPKKLPEIGRSLGKTLREFKKSTSGLMDSLNEDINSPPSQGQASPPRAVSPPAVAAAPPAPQTETLPDKAEPVEGTVGAPAPKKPAQEEEVVINLSDESEKP